MKEPVTYVTQSRYFSPAFNAAIFDGPIRIYFAQYQEPQALKVYLQLQERLQVEGQSGRGLLRDRAFTIFVMLYPTSETFDQSFGEKPEASAGASATATSPPAAAASGLENRKLARSRLGSDFVIGVRGPIQDDDLGALYTEMDAIVGAPIDA